MSYQVLSQTTRSPSKKLIQQNSFFTWERKWWFYTLCRNFFRHFISFIFYRKKDGYELQARLLTDLLNETGNNQFDTFSYQSSPSLPLKRSKPKRTLIVLIGTFLGGIIGILVALFMGAVAARKERLAQINQK